MKSQSLKTIYYGTIARATVLNFLWRRFFPLQPRSGRVILHLGCGRNYLPLPGFVNIDGNLFVPKDLWLDITLGLPYTDGCIDAVYSNHVLEHLSEKGVRRVLQESFRVLKPGGGIRLVTPHLGKAIEAYRAGNMEFFGDWPDARKSIGGKFNNYLLCRNQHRLMFDQSFLEEMLRNAGWVHIREAGPLESSIFSRKDLTEMGGEAPDAHRSLIIEALK
ncbi:MAG: methyltransferase domain-containing protein [Deltaproteobacteria bacterium]|nr:methyltransferase domain-containing protein [Deltaproteobacteria bacterium]